MFNVVKKPDGQFLVKMTTSKAIRYWVKLLVEAYFRLYKQGKFTKVQRVMDFNESYHNTNNYMRRFVKEVDIDDVILYRTVSDVRKYYEDNFEDEEEPFKAKGLREALKEYGIATGVKKINGKSCRVFMKQDDTTQVIM